MSRERKKANETWKIPKTGDSVAWWTSLEVKF